MRRAGIRARGVAEDRGPVRALVRKGVRDEKAPPVKRLTKALPEPSACRRCGAIFARRTWRNRGRVTHALLERASWTVCPACRQQAADEYYGRVLVKGAYAAANLDAIERRIRNVEARARFTQPQRRLVSAEAEGAALEVLTTSQKLAHRIVHELKKAFRGRVRYEWSSRDGALFATWERDR